MVGTRTGTGDWIVVCDGGKAVIFENAGDGKFPNLTMRETHEQSGEPTHALGTDRPGRSFQSVGSRRSAVSQTDWHDESERTFLAKLAARLEAALAERRTQSMVLVAPPRALGMIRKELAEKVRNAIVREIAKDAVKLPVGEIEKLVFGDAR
jgi:protein required for attachment to host cells